MFRPLISGCQWNHISGYGWVVIGLGIWKSVGNLIASLEDTMLSPQGTTLCRLLWQQKTLFTSSIYHWIWARFSLLCFVLVIQNVYDLFMRTASCHWSNKEYTVYLFSETYVIYKMPFLNELINLSPLNKMTAISLTIISDVFFNDFVCILI